MGPWFVGGLEWCCSNVQPSAQDLRILAPKAISIQYTVQLLCAKVINPTFSGFLYTEIDPHDIRYRKTHLEYTFPSHLKVVW